MTQSTNLNAQTTPPSLSRTSSSQRWTTEDELFFVRTLAAKRLTRHLKNYLYTARRRDWHAPGMSVDPQIVIFAAEDCIEDLERLEKHPSVLSELDQIQ